MSLWQKITGFFYDAYKWLWPHLKPIAQDIAESGGKYLMDLVSEAAQRAERTELGGYDKLKYATDYALNKIEKEWKSGELETYARQVTTTAVQGAIINTVAKYNREGW